MIIAEKELLGLLITKYTFLSPTLMNSVNKIQYMFIVIVSL